MAGESRKGERGEGATRQTEKPCNFEGPPCGNREFFWRGKVFLEGKVPFLTSTS